VAGDDVQGEELAEELDPEQLDPEQQQEEQAGPPALEVWNDYDPSMRFVAVFPVPDEQNATASSVVYYVLEPGKHTGLHADNAEEVLYVFDGEGEAFVSGRQVPFSAGDFHVLPAGTQHDIYAYGDRELRYLSFYPVPLLESTYQETLFPMGGNVLTSKPFQPVIRELSMDELPEDFPFELLGGQLEEPPADPGNEDPQPS
jgi:quercetin dioxygenase-like cupin family protein